MPEHDCVLAQRESTDVARWQAIAAQLTARDVASDIDWALESNGSGFSRQEILDIHGPDQAVVDLIEEC